MHLRRKNIPTEHHTMENKKKENIGWVDLLRIIACFLVLLAHSVDPYVALDDDDHMGFVTGAFVGSFTRACVPLFVMMTGVLLLPVKMETGTFYRKRIGRIVIPLAFWSIVMPLLYFVYLNYAFTTHSPIIVMEDHTWNATWHKWYTFVFNFNYDTIPMWYLYMLIGLYLVMPILSPWLRQASKKELETVLSIWICSFFIPYVKLLAPVLGYPGTYGNMDLFGITIWNEYGAFYYLSGYVGYLILAYYLTTYPPEWSWKKTLWTCVPMFVVSYLITAIAYVVIHDYFTKDFYIMELVWAFCGINVFLMTVAVFVVVQKMKIPSSPRMSHVASLTFGIFLCHFILNQLMYDLTGAIGLGHNILRVLLITTGTSVLSYLVAAVMYWFKLTRRFVV